MTTVPASVAAVGPTAALAPAEDKHVNLIRNLCGPGLPERGVPARRGPAWQWPRRHCQQEVRGRAACFRLWAYDRGLSMLDTAALLQVAPRTLGHWLHAYRHEALHVQALGRPVLRSPRAARNEVLAAIAELGPGVGVPALQAYFPGMPRVELHDLLGRYRRLWRRRNYEALHILHWQVAGAVWAMDFAQAPAPIDGRYPYLLAVRDLASGQQLLWLPLIEATAAEARLALASLFAVRGAPLVLKTDNGSPFVDGATLALLASAGVIPLFSPPYWPRYNGSIEAGIGSLKTRTEDHAARHGRPGHWTWEDVAAAPEQANHTARPKGPSGPTPAEIWASRPAIPADQRTRFQLTVDKLREEIRSRDAQTPAATPQQAIPEAQPSARTPDAHPDQPTQEGRTAPPSRPTQEQRALDRQAIRRALEEHGFLLYSRRRIPLPIKRRKMAKIR
jgi:transposase InsO family protein